MPTGLRRFHHSQHSHFITFTCYHRFCNLDGNYHRDAVVNALENARVRYNFRVYGFVVMPEHVHLLISEPERGTVANAIQSFKISSSKRCAALGGAHFGASGGPHSGAFGGPHFGALSRNVGTPARSTVQSSEERLPFWQRRYYDRNIRDYAEFREKLRYIHGNPVKRGLCANPEDWLWSSFRHYATGESCGVEIESEWTARKRAEQGVIDVVARGPHISG
jgi:putative transposase